MNYIQTFKDKWYTYYKKVTTNCLKIGVCPTGNSTHGVRIEMFRIPVREYARTLWMGSPFWGRGVRNPKAGTRSVSWAQIREERRRDRIGRRQEVQEDDPFMASRCQHAQSKCVHSLGRNKWMCRWHCICCTYCIYCFRKINHLVPVPFVFILWCQKPCQERRPVPTVNSIWNKDRLCLLLGTLSSGLKTDRLCTKWERNQVT